MIKSANFLTFWIINFRLKKKKTFLSYRKKATDSIQSTGLSFQ